MIGILAALVITNLPPPYYSVYADAVGAPLEKQIAILAMPLRENVRGNSTYVNTRRYLLGPDNPGFIMTPDGSENRSGPVPGNNLYHIRNRTVAVLYHAMETIASTPTFHVREQNPAVAGVLLIGLH